MEEPGGQQSMGSWTVGHDWATSLSLFTSMHLRRKWQPTPAFLPGESQGRGSLTGCRLWGRTESDTTERLPFHFSLSCIGEGNGNPLQRSCLENPKDWGAWRAAVYGVAQSQTWLKWLSSSSSSSNVILDIVLSSPKIQCERQHITSVKNINFQLCHCVKVNKLYISKYDFSSPTKWKK